MNPPVLAGGHACACLPGSCPTSFRCPERSSTAAAAIGTRMWWVRISSRRRTTCTQETNPAQRCNQTRCASPLRLADPQRSTSPGFAGGGLRASPVESSLAEGGEGVRRALARMTEGAVRTRHLSYVIPAAALQRADPQLGSRAHDRQHTQLPGFPIFAAPPLRR